jgi:hypothetical protein
MNASIITTILSWVPEAIAEAEAIIESPGAQKLIAILEKYFVHTVTPGSAVVVEPKSTVAPIPK